MADKTYWLDVAERMIKTGCQALAGVLAGSTLVDMDWRGALAIVGTAVLGSLLTSLASLPVGEAGSASALHVPRVSHDQVIDVIERAARTVQTQTTAGVTAKLDEILKQVKPVTASSLPDSDLIAAQCLPRRRRHCADPAAIVHRRMGTAMTTAYVVAAVVCIVCAAIEWRCRL